MSTKTPSHNQKDERVSITNELVNKTKQTGIPLDSQRAHDLATTITTVWIVPRNAGYSRKKFHIPSPENPEEPVCDCNAQNWHPENINDYPVGWNPICTHCFAWLLTVHYPELLDKVGDGG